MLVKLALTVLSFGVALGQGCVLETAKSGDVVKIRAEAKWAAHDMFIRPSSCSTGPENRVILVWADDPILLGTKATVRRDSVFSDFNRLLNETFPLPANSVGTGQPRYQVVAEFEGKLEVAPSAGYKRDPKTKKIIGLEGFGHPVPFTRFRLLATGVSRVESKEQQPMQHEAEHAVEAPVNR